MKYTINTISKVEREGVWYYVVGCITGQNVGTYQPYSVKEGTNLYACFKKYFIGRGDKITNALFLVPLDNWQV